ncbi:M43 family zinc metalloprotease [Neolewinella agarilytica]|uniref:M43 family zinc metalloprotease n=1 Tax=Neolewinella agarilytica TaxID=478744 RepID=UPI002357B84C|nr:M43 family zinc metalloprotease [Neolewinella agarilytica]
MLSPFRFLTTLFVLAFCLPLFGQSGEEHLNCATDELHQKLRATDPAYGEDLDDLEAAWSREARKARLQKSSPPPFVLPIVFHIVHQNGTENISNTDIQRSLDFTNQAFANTGYYDQGTGSPTNIEFCLARRDPDNQATNGINRIVSPLTDLDSDNDRDLKDLSRWEPRDYVNVWVVKEICGLGLGCGVAGYAYYPSAHGGRVDGIVVEARWLAGDEAKVGVLIHELGHYLGLRHTFDGGCTNDDCTTDGDRVCDTPPDQSKVAVPCSGTSNSCTTDTDSGFATDQNDMFINYMDYGFFSCYSAFTAGQRDRMHFFLDGRRNSLLESLGCLNPCPAVVDASFNGGDVTVEAGTTLNFTNLSSNGDSYEWSSNGTTFSTSFNASRLFDQTGTFIIRLRAESNDNLCLSDEFEQRVTVICSVTAGFTPPDTLEVGRELLFINTSGTQMNTSWTVDNTSAGNDPDLVETFDSPGLYNICAEVDNGFCDDRFCRLIFVREPPCTGPGCPGQGADTCTAAFVQSYIRPDDETEGTFTTVLPRKDGQFVGGRLFNSPIVLSLAEDGTPLWQTQLFPGGDQGTIIEMMLDGEGMLAGIGRTEEREGGSTSTRNSFVFRIDPANGNLLWGRGFSFFEGADFRAILQPGLMEDYTLIGNHATPNSGTESGLFLRIDPATGTITDLPKLFRSNGVTFERALYDSAAGLYQVVGDAAVSSMSAGLLYVTLDLGGEVFSSGILDNVTARGFFYDLIQEGNHLVAATDRFPAGVNGFTTHLYKIGPENELLWNRFYTEGGSPLPILDLDQNGIGYLLLARGLGATLVLIQTDRDGNVVWARRYSGVNFNNALRSELMAVARENIYLATQSGGQLPTLLRLEADGSSASDCVPDELIDVSSQRVEVQGSNLDLSTIDLQAQGQRFFSEPFSLVVNGESCREPCDTIMVTEPEICDNQIDDDGNGFTDCEDPALINTCCCIDGPRLGLGPDTLLCRGDTLRVAIDSSIVNYLWSNGDTTATTEITEPGRLWLTVTDSCGRTATDTITLHLRQRPQLLLGPDTTLCSNAVIPLLAQDGFASYQWVDGSDEKSFTAYDAGSYWVIATDSCGGVQTDTVNVTIDPVTVIDLGQDTTICPGDTLTFSVSGFSNYQWSQSSFIDCTDCPEVRFAPTSDTLLLVAADAGPGCFSSDSIRIRMAPTAGRRDSLFICAGDSTIFAGDTLTTEGQYYGANQSLTCAISDTLDLFLLDTFYRLDTQFICAGSSTMLFGEMVSEAGIYSQTLPAINGCDSTLAIELLLRPTFESFDTLRICPGDSARIFGAFERETNDFSRTFPSQFLCDSTVNIRLEVSGIDFSVRQTSSSCEGAAAGAGEVIISNGLPPYRIRWSSGDSSLRVEGLAAGDYTLTVTDAAGCAAASTLSITASSSAQLSLSPTAESCPGENDGSLRITGTQAGLSFSLDAQSFSPDSTLQNLAPGDYTLFVNDTTGCDQQLTFTIDAATGFFLDLPPDQSIRFGDSLTLTPNTNLPAEVPILWLTSEGAGCPGCDELTLRPLETVTVFASANGGSCPVADSTTISVVRGELFYVPNAFSPNGDGVNDEFRLFPGPAVDRILSFSVFDRWGGRVFFREDLDPAAALAGWDGSRENGGTAPQTGVFVYLVEVRLLNGEIVKKAGDVTMMR